MRVGSGGVVGGGSGVVAVGLAASYDSGLSSDRRQRRLPRSSYIYRREVASILIYLYARGCLDPLASVSLCLVIHTRLLLASFSCRFLASFSKPCYWYREMHIDTDVDTEMIYIQRNRSSFCGQGRRERERVERVWCVGGGVKARRQRERRWQQERRCARGGE